jgi:hypothetical protein
MKGDDVFPPVVVFRERRRGTLWLADGQHRVMAARQLNRAQIEADLRGGDRRDARSTRAAPTPRTAYGAPTPTSGGRSS